MERRSHEAEESRPEIRRAESGDAETLSRLGAETFTETFRELYSPRDLAAFLAESHTPEGYRRLIADPAFGVWLAESSDGRALGYAVAGPCKLPIPQLAPTAGELHRIYVLGPSQGTGLGARLLYRALRFLEARHDPIYLGVYSGNAASHRFYERHGFVKVGDYGFRVGEQVDAEWIMQWRPVGDDGTEVSAPASDSPSAAASTGASATASGAKTEA